MRKRGDLPPREQNLFVAFFPHVAGARRGSMEQPDSPPRRVRKTKVKMKPPERCWSCRGLTYFSTAMRDQNKKPVCLGMSRTLASPPPPFLSMGEIDRAALEQVGEEEDSLWRETERTRPMDIYYLCFGTAVVTSKMKKDGGMPFCDRGQICTFAIPRSVEGEHAGDAQSEGNSRLPQVGLHNMPDSTEVMESVKARLVSGACDGTRSHWGGPGSSANHSSAFQCIIFGGRRPRTIRSATCDSPRN